MVKNNGLANIIKFEGDGSTLIWRHPIEDFNFGSQLIVHESQQAIFFRDGQALDLFGAGRHTLETQQFPILEKVYHPFTSREKTFHSQVYFINCTTQLGIKWGTDSKISLFDPVSGLHLSIGAGGEFNFKVSNGRKLLVKLQGTENSLDKDNIIGIDSGKTLFKGMLMTQVKTHLATTIKELKLNILEIDEHLIKLSDGLKDKMNDIFDDYGLEITDFFVSRIVTPDDDIHFRKMKDQYAKQYLLVKEEEIRKQEILAQAERRAAEEEMAVRMKIINAKGEAEAIKIKKEAEVEVYRMQAEVEAEEMKLKQFDYSQETARKVGMEAMKNGVVGSDGGNSMIGDLAGVGVAVGAMSGMMGMSRDIVSPVFDNLSQKPQNETWNCSCGARLTDNFCSNCGTKKPDIHWDCDCGAKQNQGQFCSHCGQKRQGVSS